MGIYDRDYYRESSTDWWGFLGSRPATVGLIVVSCAVFVGQLMTRVGRDGSDLFMLWGDFYPPAIFHGQVWRLLTAYFLDDTSNFLRLAFNMLILYWAGREIEGIYGSREFLCFYLFSALLISLGSLVLAATELIDPEHHQIGSGGPVTTTFLLYACHYPYRKILLFFILPVPVWALALGTLVIGFMGALGSGRPGIGLTTYLIGGLFAYLYFRSSLRLSSLLAVSFTARARRAPPPRLFVPPVDDDRDPVRATPPNRGGRGAAAERDGSTLDEHLEAKVDQVLEKVARFGRESLSPDEHELLLKASEIYKRRRGS
ncbi:rhomboid family intramembrane serine protease [Fimbriiglobus ruber]|uniref:Rhomboid family serine protease n=1 Tax=Fimbriiglobus ruber TaxID=1908690 RepID=A0A225DC47_9BACT|nr:rhomboid family intramembrane serine protease [Fimbriiglobus ruber]OWK34866.1 rhomboid family serine protease [Fimbriiglobus ruber]